MVSRGASDEDPCIVESLLYLKDCPYGTVKKRKKLDIVLTSSETITWDRRVVRSSVKVQYFSVRDNEAVLLLGLHYDYDNPALNAHPYFHVQIGKSNMTCEQLKEIKFRHTYVEEPDTFPGGIRIPTVHMGLCSTLLKIAADHFPATQFSNFRNVARSKKPFSEFECEIGANTLAGSPGLVCLQSHRFYR